MESSKEKYSERERVGRVLEDSMETLRNGVLVVHPPHCTRVFDHSILACCDGNAEHVNCKIHSSIYASFDGFYFPSFMQCLHCFTTPFHLPQRFQYMHHDAPPFALLPKEDAVRPARCSFVAK